MFTSMRLLLISLLTIGYVLTSPTVAVPQTGLKEPPAGLICLNREQVLLDADRIGGNIWYSSLIFLKVDSIRREEYLDYCE